MARKETDRRVTATLDQAIYDKLVYAAENKGISISEALREAVDLFIRYANEDYYPLAKLEAVRFNQLTDGVSELSSDMKNLMNVVVEGFSSLINITKGDNYLFDEEEEL